MKPAHKVFIGINQRITLKIMHVEREQDGGIGWRLGKIDGEGLAEEQRRHDPEK